MLLIAWGVVLFIASCGDGYTAIERASAARAQALRKMSDYVTLMRNTAIFVTLADSIDTDVHGTGEEFRAILTQPIVVDRDTVFDIGAEAKGILSSVIESGGHKSCAELKFCLTGLRDSRGQWIRIGTHTIEERRASSTSKTIILVGGGGIVGGVAMPDVNTNQQVSPARHSQGIFHGPGTELVFFSNESTRIALR